MSLVAACLSIILGLVSISLQVNNSQFFYTQIDELNNKKIDCELHCDEADGRLCLMWPHWRDFNGFISVAYSKHKIPQ